MIETKFNEVRYKTSDPQRMLNKYTAGRVLQTWTEDFVDEDTGKVVSIERNNVLFEKGVLIDQDVQAQINFYITSGDIKEVEVSNQRRIAYELENNSTHPYLCQIEMDRKKHKFLLYASTIDMAKTILKDYVELNYRHPFWISMIKEFDPCIILTDRLKEYIKDEPISEINSEDIVEDTPDSDKKKKFYQIDSKITCKSEDGDNEIEQRFVVHTFNIDRAMMLIENYLKQQEEKRKDALLQKERKYVETTFYPMIELAKPIPVGCFIPREFSEVYV